jgi:ParB family chromosome partitioning protein
MFEIAHALRIYCEDNEISQDDAAKRLFLSKSYVSAKLRLLKLGYEEQRAITELSLTEEHARALLRLESSGERMSVIRKIADEDLTPRETDEYIDRLLGADKSEDIEEALLGVGKNVGVAVRGVLKRLDALKNSGKDVQIETHSSGKYIDLRIRIEK